MYPRHIPFQALRRRLAAAALALLAALVCSPTSLANVDQFQADTSGGGTRIKAGETLAQTVTAGRTGNLNAIQMSLLGIAGNATSLDVDIESVSGGFPTGTVLASTSLAAADVPSAGTSFFVSIPIGPIPVASGTQYAIVAGTSGAHDSYSWSRASGDVYAGGAALRRLDPNPFTVSLFDLAFRTFVDASSTAAQLRSLTAERTDAAIRVRWRTASETDLAGFNVYRQVQGRRVRANAHVIPAHGAGAYSFLDRKAPRARASRYWIQSVDLDGSRRWYGPARVSAER